MKRLSFVFFLCLGFVLGSTFAQADATAVSTGTSGIIATVLAIVGVAVPLFNVLMSALTQGFAILHKAEPSWLQTLGTYGMKISQWLSANTTAPVPVTAVVAPNAQGQVVPVASVTPPASS